MSLRAEQPLSPTERRRQVASILAKGVIRWRRRAKSNGNIDAEKSPPVSKNHLAISAETSLSVSDATRGFTLRGDGDNA